MAEKKISPKIKSEILEEISPKPSTEAAVYLQTASVIDLSSSSSDSDSDDLPLSDDDVAGDNSRPKKKKKVDGSTANVKLPLGFLDPLPTKETRLSSSSPAPLAVHVPGDDALLALPAPKGIVAVSLECNAKQFWKAGDYEGAPSGDWDSSFGGMDHVRVHPRFLHSNATSHKWVLGAFAELLDNSLDEVCNGSTYVNIDMIENKKDGNRMLLIEDNGGGMNPDKMRQCMSLGYSAKSKIADTIGQYGNGFKTSTMRLGADVIVFSRSCGKEGNRSTQSIGLLSYTFLRGTGKEDIVVPMLDYERRGQAWDKIIRSSAADWSRNVDTIVKWSPFSSEADLLQQFNWMKDHGTRIIIYNLWEDDQGLLELDFDADPHDIQIRGVNRDEKNIQMAQQHPNSRHFLTYRHSLRSYASILYLRIPPGFRIILRGKDVEHHNIVNDMMMTKEVTYRPQAGVDGIPRDVNMVAIVNIGFVKDANAHIDVQGFNVYHKNRLIKPFWRVWHPPGSDGRGVIGVLEANFVEPAHDKQGFERTTVLSRLEKKLVEMQKHYWTSNCHKIGYAPRRNKKSANEEDNSPDSSLKYKSAKNAEMIDKAPDSGKRSLRSNSVDVSQNGHTEQGNNRSRTSGKRLSYSERSSPAAEDVSDDDGPTNVHKSQRNDFSQKSSSTRKLHGKHSSQTVRSPMRSRSVIAGHNFSKGGKPVGITTELDSESEDVGNGSSEVLDKLKEENHVLRERIERKEEEILGDLLKDLDEEKKRCKSLEAQLDGAKEEIQELRKEQESLIDIFSEERQRREIEEENLRKKLKDASNTIQDLLDKVRLLEKTRSISNGKRER
ncbi:protein MICRORCHIDIA 7-like [Coffea arabica]|uniref:Protein MICRORCHIDIA 7-like n=1 Tax=Coffea arabica TaxID=13443 RepID=A0A6P6X745_COFAR